MQLFIKIGLYTLQNMRGSYLFNRSLACVACGSLPKTVNVDFRSPARPTHGRGTRRQQPTPAASSKKPQLPAGV